MKKENSFLSWCWKGSCHDASFSIGNGNVGNCNKRSVTEIMFLIPHSFEPHFRKYFVAVIDQLIEADKKKKMCFFIPEGHYKSNSVEN